MQMQQLSCFYHPHSAAAGICQQCGKSACRDCLHDIPGALLCVSCVQYVQANIETSVQDEVAVAKRAILFSWIFTALWGGIQSLYIIATAFSSKGGILSLIFIPVVLYLAWSLYWGWKPVWNGWSNFFNSLGCAVWGGIGFVMVVTAIFFIIPVMVATIFGALGGGIIKYLKLRRIIQAGRENLSW